MKKIVLILNLLICSIILISCGRSNMAYGCSDLYAFDTIIHISLDVDNGDYTLTSDEAKNLYNTISRELNELSRITNNFSSNESNTSVYDINEKRTLEVSDKLIDIIKYSVNLIEDTNGYFNPFMGRLSAIWKDTIKSGKLPSDELIKSEVEIVKNTSVEVEGNRVTIKGDGDIDLGGVVKGYALEWIRNYLNSNKVINYILDCGSSSVYVGSKTTKISISKPYNSGYIDTLSIENKGVATSNGKHQNVVIDGKRYHHLISPFTGYPSNTFDSVSVIAGIDNGLMDAYSTAIFSMTEDEAKEFSKKKGIDLILYSGDTVVHHSN